MQGSHFPQVPIAAEFPFGHCDPIATLPLGAPCGLEVRDGVRLATLEPSVALPGAHG